jgi:hypothetical protein
MIVSVEMLLAEALPAPKAWMAKALGIVSFPFY